MESSFQTQLDDNVIARAIAIIKTRIGLRHDGKVHDRESVGKLFLLELGQLPYEVFSAAFFNSHGQLLKFRQLHRGSVDECKVYVRELVREAMACNAASVVIGHNHPSGNKIFSDEDCRLTDKCRSALRLMDINLVDHILVADAEYITL